MKPVTDHEEALLSALVAKFGKLDGIREAITELARRDPKAAARAEKELDSLTGYIYQKEQEQPK